MRRNALKHAKERRIVLDQSQGSGFFGPQRSFAPNELHHLVPGLIRPIEAVLGIAHAAMVNMNFADDAPSISLIVDRIFPFLGIPIPPEKQVFVADLDLSTITNEIDAKFILVTDSAGFRSSLLSRRARFVNDEAFEQTGQLSVSTAFGTHVMQCVQYGRPPSRD